MNGLLIKDVLILVKQKKLFFIYFASAVMLSFAMDSSFVVSYFTMIGSLLVMTTISYDTYDNGMPFLMTLPTDGKTYSREKFIFSLFVTFVSWAAGVATQIITQLLQQKDFDVADLISMDLAFLPVFIIVVSVIIPVNLKYGAEKGHVILIVLIGIVVGIGFLLKTAFTSLLKNPDKIDLEYWIQKFGTIPQGSIVLIAFGISFVVFLIGMAVSSKIMSKKEF